MRIHIFQCSNITYKACIQKALFGSPKQRPLNEIRIDDFAVLYNVNNPKTVHGIWRVVQAGEDLDTTAWDKPYPIQARVQLVTNEIIKKPQVELKDVFPEKPKFFLEGSDANKLYQAFDDPDVLTVPAIMSPNSQSSKYHIPFFDEMTSTNDWKVFEDRTHDLLRVIGINDLYEIPRPNSAGRSDGFFILRNLAVIYDATLNANKQNDKAQQIENYVNQLNSGRIRLPDHKSKSVHANNNKRVWIITQGNSMFWHADDDVRVCEIGIVDLMQIYERRISKKLSLDQLEEILTKLGSP